MLRDTLEMIPVAIIMTLIMAFGARTGRTPSISRPPAAVIGTGAHGSTVRLPAHSASAAGRDDENAGPATAAAAEAIAENADAPRLFLDKTPQRSDIPFYTSRDIDAMRQPRGVGAPPSSPPLPSAAAARGEDAVSRASNSHLIAINRAGVRELQRIPGVGPIKARALLERRPVDGYKTWNEIDQVSGIGAGMIETMKLHATLE